MFSAFFPAAALNFIFSGTVQAYLAVKARCHLRFLSATFILLFFGSGVASAQAPEWLQVKKANIWKNQNNDIQMATTLDGYGNVYMVGMFWDSISIDTTKIYAVGGTDGIVAKYSLEGDLIWYKIIADVGNDRATAVTVDQDGNCYVAGFFAYLCQVGDSLYNGFNPILPGISSGGIDGYLVKIAPDGHFLWSRHFNGNGSEWPEELQYDQDKGLVVSGFLSGGRYHRFGNTLTGDTIIEHSGDYAIFQARYDTSGNFYWVNGGNSFEVWVWGADVDREGNSFAGGRITGGFYNFGSFQGAGINSQKGFISKTAKNGTVLWVKTFPNDRSCVNGVVADGQGGCYVTGYFREQLQIGSFSFQAIGEYDSFIAHFDADGNVISAKKLTTASEPNYVNRIIRDPYGGIYVEAQSQGNFYIDNHVLNLPGYNIHFLLSFDSELNFKWAKLVSTYSNGDDVFLHMTEDGRIVVTGCVNSFNNYYVCGVNFFQGRRYIGILDVPEDYRTTLVTGKAFQERNTNCQPDADESGVGGLVFKVQPGDRYSYSRTDGTYQVRVPVRDTLSQVTITPAVVQQPAFTATPICPPALVHTVAIDTFPDTLTGKNFGYQVPTCHRMEVSIASNRRRRCFINSTCIEYQNSGKLEAPNAYILVEYPRWVRPRRSTRTYVALNDSVWRFNLGNVAPGASGKFFITDSVLCNNINILGMVQCTKATVFPAPDCSPTGNWSGAEVSVQGKCQNGIVTMGIYNRTTNNMVDSVDYWMYLDSIQIRTGKVKLAAGDSLKFEINAVGYTFHCAVNQVANHPAQVFVSLTIEACSLPFLPRGVAYPIPQQPNSKIHCLEVRGSYDPNDKQVFPKGFTNQGIVLPGTRLHYHIRFQNTGTDTAFIVYVLDTLSDNLDLSTLVFGPTSHTGTVTILKTANGKNVLRWYFDPIFLPHKAVNEPASNGFIDFFISPKPGIPLGTQAENRAAIYFDFNPPIITNTTLSTFDTITFTNPSLNNNVQVLAPVSFPQISTLSATGITQTSAVATANIASDGGAPVTVRGFCWNTAPNPTTALATKTVSGSGIGNFSSNLTGLQPNTTYYLRAYAVNTKGTAYGGQVQFTTLAPAVIPAVTSGLVMNITSTTATMDNEVTFNGNTTVTSRGVCWSTEPNPTESLPTKTDDGIGTGLFTSSLTDLLPNTLYYARAYAKNIIGTAYGVQRQFTTLTTGLDSEINAPKAVFFPNPVNGQALHVSLPVPASLTLYNAKGQVIYAEQNLAGTITIPVSLEAGLYMGRIVTEKGTSTEKIVVLK